MKAGWFIGLLLWQWSLLATELCVTEPAAGAFPRTSQAAAEVAAIIADRKAAGMSVADYQALTAPVYRIATEETAEYLPEFRQELQATMLQPQLMKTADGTRFAVQPVSARCDKTRDGKRMLLIAVGTANDPKNVQISDTERLEDCATTQCLGKLKALAAALNQVEHISRNWLIDAVIAKVDLLDSQWQRFLTESRSQTWLDVGVSAWSYQVRYADEYQTRLNAPPKYQLFALHPSLIVENVSAALDGDQVQESLALELIGINWWDKTAACDLGVKFACGASLIATYTDRAGVKDKGWGLMFHIDNAYSFGFTRHGSDNGVFITVDLLKLFEQKERQFSRWTDKIK